MQVEYRELDEYPGYRFCADGSVWSAWTRGRTPCVGDTWRKLKSTRLKYGHQNIMLSGGRHRLVHRLILQAFVGPAPAGTECRHLNGDPSDNRIENLKWGTSEENTGDSFKHGTVPMGSASAQAKLTEEEVLKIVELRRAGESVTKIANEIGISVPNIYAITNGRSWNHLTGIPRSEAAKACNKRIYARKRERRKMRREMLTANPPRGEE